ncbi:LysR family transcriptional regulator [Amycolatopsis sp. NPDC049868]|uniref:LysR family transcriptional regulator n=1 Tax=Amycolatopsis sp. NPDC049868 TaxID=3363934 RepID=UPI0037A9C9CA
MDLDAAITFIAVAEAGQFQVAADDLGITQQAASKRVASLERQLGVQLFLRSSRGARLSVDGLVLLPHAREFVRAAQRAVAAVASDRTALRIDVASRRTAPSHLLDAFQQKHPHIELDVVTLTTSHPDAALAAVRSGSLDATFRTLRNSAGSVPHGLRVRRAINDRLQLLVGPQHPLAKAKVIQPTELGSYPIWVHCPADPEQEGYYADLAAAFDLTIDTIEPSYPLSALLSELADSTELATFVLEGSRCLRPQRLGLCQIPIVDPTPLYPVSIIWRADKPHTTLPSLLTFLQSSHAPTARGDRWLPGWAN